MKKLLLKSLVFLFIGQINFAQDFDKSKVDAYLSLLEQNNKLMGSFAVLKNGKIIYQNAIGFANVAQKQKATPNTQYRVGSITKTFTAVLTMQAVEKNKLKLDQPLSDFFPKVKNANKITIRHLLNHQSGIFNITNTKDYFEWYKTKISKDNILQKIYNFESNFEPGTTTEYSNSNYILLSYILEKIHKKSFADLIKNQIVKPLNLKNTYLAVDAQVKPNEAYSYFFNPTEDAIWEKSENTNMNFVTGAGALISTPTDLVLFAEALFNGKLVSKESLKQMQTIENGLGLGLFTFPFYEAIAYGHTGGIDKYEAIFGYFPEKNIAYANIINGANTIVNDVHINILSAAFGLDFDLPDFSKSDNAPKNRVIGYEGVYSSADVPIKITIFKEGEQLFAQAEGQGAFPLTEKSKDVFVFELANIEIEFKLSEYSFLIKQGGLKVLYKKE